MKKFDKTFRLAVIAALLQDAAFLQAAIPVLGPEHFETDLERFTVESIQKSVQATGHGPSKPGLFNDLIELLKSKGKPKTDDKEHAIVIAPATAFVDHVFGPINGTLEDVKATWMDFAKTQVADALVLEVHNDLEAGTCTWSEAAERMKTIPDRVGQIGQPQGQPVIITMSDVQREKVKWLWPGHLPLGKLAIIDGDPGLFKSGMTIDLAARVSTGREMPDGSNNDIGGPAGVVLMAAEDDQSDTIGPRLDVAGADSTRVHLLTGKQFGQRQHIITLQDVESIRTTVRQTGAKLVVIDPLFSFLGGKNSFKDSEIREVLTPLTKMAAEEGVAVVAIRHLNKTGGGNPLYRGGGSIAFVAAARAAFVVAKDPEDEPADDSEQRYIFAATKMNLCPKPKSMAYMIEAVDGIPRVKWVGTSDQNAAGLLRSQDDRRGEDTKVDEAKEYLKAALKDGPRPAAKVEVEALTAGIRLGSLGTAKRRLGVVSVKKGPGWLWSLPEVKAESLTPSTP